MERKIRRLFQEWLESGRHEALIVKGARQVGKTYSIMEFITEKFESAVVIDFFQNPGYHSIFEGDLSSDSIIEKMEFAIKGFRFVPGKTVIFLDEIQFCPNARTALKFLAQDERIKVIASGSLLGLNYGDVKSYPIGYERSVDMYPMDFEEFLWATGVSEKATANLRSLIRERKHIEKSTRDSINSYFMRYIVVGGMPEAVASFVSDGNIHSVRSIQKKIVEGYRNDIGKYSVPTERDKIYSVLDSLPFQLAQDSKKFVYSRIGSGREPSSKTYMTSIQWMVDAGTVIKCNNLTNPKLPFTDFVDEGSFKLYLNDPGLLISMMSEDVVHAILSGDTRVNKGSVTENTVACCLRSCGHTPRYFSAKNFEIDFITSMRRSVVAAEVKSGNNRKSKSLDSMKERYGVGRRMKFENTDIKADKKGIEHYPLFLCAFIDELYEPFELGEMMLDPEDVNRDLTLMTEGQQKRCHRRPIVID